MDTDIMMKAVKNLLLTKSMQKSSNKLRNLQKSKTLYIKKIEYLMRKIKYVYIETTACNETGSEVSYFSWYLQKLDNV